MTDQSPLLCDQPLVLDGGLSNVLAESGCKLDPLLWTAGLLVSDPESLVAAHLQYLRAGADIVTTAGYQASIPGFRSAGYDEREAKTLLLRAVDLAIEAREQFPPEWETGRAGPFIAASMGPYGAFLADGSEYTGAYGVGDDTLREFHQPRLDVLASSRADLLAFETMPNRREIEVVAGLLAGISIPVWVSFSCLDGSRLRDGEGLAEVVPLLATIPEIFALGVNCTAPEHVSDVIRLLRELAPGKKIVVYPNSGEIYQPTTRTWLGSSDPRDFRSMASAWLRDGADIIGGCCQIGPAHIRQLRELVGQHEGADLGKGFFSTHRTRDKKQGLSNDL